VGRDPCSLLTAQEAEAVLGRLVVPPYRSHERTPLAERGGRSCAYYTAGHHALVLTPVWDYAGGGVEAIHTAGGLLSTLVPGGTDAVADTLDGDWDEVGTDRTTGELYFLMGDRLLALDYLASSTDADGAIRLAKIATERLGRGDTKQPRAAPGAGAVSSRCPAAADVGAAVGFPTTAVRAEDGGPHWVTCVYELTGRYRGVFVEIKTEPVSRAETRFAELRQRVKRARGQDAEPDRIAVGDGGWAYGSGAGSQAAAVAGDHVHRATMEYFGYGSIGDQKDAMVRVLRLATR
jgi:hypothetical protein